MLNVSHNDDDNYHSQHKQDGPGCTNTNPSHFRAFIHPFWHAKRTLDQVITTKRYGGDDDAGGAGAAVVAASEGNVLSSYDAGRVIHARNRIDDSAAIDDLNYAGDDGDENMHLVCNTLSRRRPARASCCRQTATLANAQFRQRRRVSYGVRLLLDVLMPALVVLIFVLLQSASSKTSFPPHPHPPLSARVGDAQPQVNDEPTLAELLRAVSGSGGNDMTHRIVLVPDDPFVHALAARLIDDQIPRSCSGQSLAQCANATVVDVLSSVVVMESENAMLAAIAADDYGSGVRGYTHAVPAAAAAATTTTTTTVQADDFRSIFAAVVFDSWDVATGVYSYTLRANHTHMPASTHVWASSSSSTMTPPPLNIYGRQFASPSASSAALYDKWGLAVSGTNIVLRRFVLLVMYYTAVRCILSFSAPLTHTHTHTHHSHLPVGRAVKLVVRVRMRYGGGGGLGVTEGSIGSCRLKYKKNASDGGGEFGSFWGADGSATTADSANVSSGNVDVGDGSVMHFRAASHTKYQYPQSQQQSQLYCGTVLHDAKGKSVVKSSRNAKMQHTRTADNVEKQSDADGDGDDDGCFDTFGMNDSTKDGNANYGGGSGARGDIYYEDYDNGEVSSDEGLYIT